MKNITTYLNEAKRIELKLDDFDYSDKKISKQIQELENDLFEYVDSHEHEHHWKEEDVMSWLQDEDGLVDWADENDISSDIIGKMINDYHPNVITYWVHKWIKENE